LSERVTRNDARPPAPIFALVLRAGPSCDDPIRALRMLLKIAKRRFGLICVSADGPLEKVES
jgi:hypothetical protein